MKIQNLLFFGLLFFSPVQAGEHEEGEDRLDLPPKVLKEFGIELAEASSGKIALTKHLTGEVALAPDLVFHVVPLVSGIVREVFKEIGNRVKKGELLLVLSSRELAEAKAELLINKSRLDLARANFARIEKLYRQGITPQRDFLKAKQEKITAAVELDAARHRLLALGISPEEIEALLHHRRETDLARYELRAPASGEVIEKHASKGEFLRADRSAFVLADLKRVWVWLTVYQKDLDSIRPGQRVQISLGEGWTSVWGTIDYLSPVLEEATRTARARVILENREGRLRPGMFVSAEAILSEVPVRVVVPRSALVELEDQTVLFVRKEDHFEPRPVILGHQNSWQVEIRQGIEPGERYVAKGAFLFKAELAKGAFTGGHHH